MIRVKTLIVNLLVVLQTSSWWAAATLRVPAEKGDRILWAIPMVSTMLLVGSLIVYTIENWDGLE